MATIDYNFYPDRETAEQYNARIAAARGDSSTSLASMQTATKTAYDKAGLSTTSLVTNPTQTYLSKYGAPSTASAIDSGYQPYTAPTLPSYFGDITGATAGMTGYGSMIEANQKFAEQQLQMQQQQEQKQQSLLEKFMGSVKSPAEARGDAWDETGMDVQKYFAQQAAGVKEIEALTNQYNQVVAAKDAQIAQTNDKMASMNFINNQTAQIERNAAPQLTRLSAQINAKAATLEALQGNFAQAQQYVNQAVQDAVADYKFKADMYSELYRINEDSFNRTQAIYSDAFKTQMGIAEAEYNRQYEEKTAMAELLLKYPTAGIDLTKDTLADAYKKAGLVAPTGSVPDLTADMRNYNAAVDQGYKGTFAEWLGKEGGGTSTSNFSDIMQQAIDAGATPEQAAREAATASELTGIPVDQKTLNSWTTYARTLSPTPKRTSVVSGSNTVSSYDNIYSSLAEQLFGY